MFYREIKKYKNKLNFFDKMNPLKRGEVKIEDGFLLKQFPYYFEDSFGKHFVNVYSLEISDVERIGFAMEFSRNGGYCIDLVKQASSKIKGRIIGALNCNFGLIVDEYDRYPVDLSYNLHLQENRLIQIPVIDKSAILIKGNGSIEMKFLYGEGAVVIGNFRIGWVGARSKKYNYFYARERCIAYNSFCRGLLLVKNRVTGTKKLFDQNRSRTPIDRKKVDLVIGEKEGALRIIKINETTGTHLFEGNFILSIPVKHIKEVKLGDRVTIKSIDSIDPTEYKYGATGSPLLGPDVKKARNSILPERSVQTRTLENKGAYQKNVKFCRSCIVKDKDKAVFFLADARKGKKGQEGLSLYMLGNLLAELYPNLISAVNVDGGSAPKLIVNKEDGYDVLGNLQYKKWPTKMNPKFTWNGYYGRKVPAIIYTYLKQ